MVIAEDTAEIKFEIGDIVAIMSRQEFVRRSVKNDVPMNKIRLQTLCVCWYLKFGFGSPAIIKGFTADGLAILSECKGSNVINESGGNEYIVELLIK